MVIKESSSTPASLRRTHRGLMLSRIQAEPGVSRADLARGFGFSEMAATRIARDLLGAGIIEEFDLAGAPTRKKKKIGRPKIGLRISPTGVYAAGITVSAYYSEVSICDANGKTVARQDVDNPSFSDIAGTARLYSDALLSLINETAIDPDRLVGVGVALSAKTTPDKDDSVRSEYFGWDDDGGLFWRELRRNTGLPVAVENIANALAIAEMRFGVARAVSDFALVHVATFAGVGAVSDSQIVRGAAGGAGRIGHLRAAETTLTCTCGRSDCLNLSATGYGILGRIGALNDPAFDRSRLRTYANALLAAIDDPATAPHARAAGQSLAVALDPLVKLLAPEMIVLNGVLGTDAAYFDGITQALQAEGLAQGAQLVRGEVAPYEAASLLALHTFCYSDQLDFERLSANADADGERAAYA